MHTKDIQRSIYFYCKCRQNEFMVSNKHLHYWFECDFMSITKAGFLTEFEIKQSKSDFKRDFTDKLVKHEWLKGKRTGELLVESTLTTQSTYKDIIVDTPTPNFIGLRKNIKMDEYQGPNYFYYVCPENLIEVESIPDYAGLFYVVDNNTNTPRLKLIKQAPRLHKAKVSDERKLNVLTKYMYDYWKHHYEQK
jgi:hypothetical protein